MAQKINLVNTTWKVESKELRAKNWDNGGTLTFLPKGKIKGGDLCAFPQSWKLVGNKLSYDDGCAGMKFTVIIKGNQASGKGTWSWRETPVIVRLIKQ